MRILAPAKINLFLHITGRRPDGYHLLESLFVPIDWCDEVLLREASVPGELRRIGAMAWPEHEDLGLRAAQALRSALAEAGAFGPGPLPGADIEIRKHLPHGAGLGGGSSDAAAVMRGLLRLWDVEAPRRLLESVAISLGADVPFFLDPRPSWVGGIGEVRQPVALPGFGLLLLVPEVSVPTATIFQDPALVRDHDPMPTPWSEALELDGLRQGSNALQPVARRLFPAVGQALDLLHEVLGDAAIKIAMSGSGGACFALMASPRQADDALPRLRAMASRWGMACSLRTCEPLLRAPA